MSGMAKDWDSSPDHILGEANSKRRRPRSACRIQRPNNFSGKALLMLHSRPPEEYRVDITQSLKGLVLLGNCSHCASNGVAGFITRTGRIYALELPTQSSTLRIGSGDHRLSHHSFISLLHS